MTNAYMLSPKDKEKDCGDLARLEMIYSKVPEIDAYDHARPSLTRKYETVEQVMAELRKNDAKTHTILSKMQASLRKDQDAMLKLIELESKVYLYVNSQIKNDDFTKSALEKNPNVYSYLSDDDRKKQELSDAYLCGMLNNTRQRHVGNNTLMLQFKNQFDPHMNTNQVLSPTTYEKAYENMVVDGPYTIDGRTLSKDFSVVLACRMLNKECAHVFDEIDAKVWDRHPEKVIEWAQNDRRDKEVNNVLNAIEAISPRYAVLIEEMQKDYWHEQADALQMVKSKQEAGTYVSQAEKDMLMEAEKHISLDISNRDVKPLPQLETMKDQELKENLLKIEQLRVESQQRHYAADKEIEKEREENLAYLLQDSKTRVLSAAAMGDIEPEEASLALGYLGSIPTTTTSSRAYTALENTEARENDIDNIDRDLAYTNDREEQENDRSQGYDANEDYEQNYAWNPFVSYVNPEGQTQEYK